MADNCRHQRPKPPVTLRDKLSRVVARRFRPEREARDNLNPPRPTRHTGDSLISIAVFHGRCVSFTSRVNCVSRPAANCISQLALLPEPSLPPSPPPSLSLSRARARARVYHASEIGDPRETSNRTLRSRANERSGNICLLPHLLPSPPLPGTRFLWHSGLLGLARGHLAVLIR